MTFLPRPLVGRGWVPDADASGGPADALLRADNLTLDEIGVLAVRRGSTPVNGPFGDLDVHSLYTEVLNGIRFRMSGAGNAVYSNGGSIVAGLDGSGDIAFGGHLGQILFARGTSRYKFDGTTLRTWGIPMTGNAPTVTASTADGKTFASGALAESPAFVINEDDGTGLAYAANHAGTADSAVVLKPNTTSGRGALTKTFTSPTDFTVYDAGAHATDDDLLSLYVYVTEPADLLAIDLMVDCFAGDFQTDYYLGTFSSTPDATVGASVDILKGKYDVEGVDRDRIRGTQEPVTGVAVSRVRTDKPVSGVGWSKVSIRRSQMARVGASAGKDWTTVKAVRLVVTTSSSTLLRFDTIRIEGGQLLGTYKWAYVLAYNTGSYVALSAPSPFSAETTLQTTGASIVLPADAVRDQQFNEVWVYRMGGVLDAFYRTAVLTGQSGVDPITVADDTSDADALVTNLRLETSNGRPPANILDIEGPYYDRTFVLTRDGFLWPSRRLNPDSFSSEQGIRVAAADETAYWVKKAFGGLYIGTSKDIYRMTGTGAEFADGTLDFVKTPLNIDHPPISDAIAQEGNLLVYLAADGWRAAQGESSLLLTGDTSLLYRGRDRHGVRAVNLATGRFRAAITKGQLTALTPEGTSTTSSNVLYRQAPTRQAWYRHTYTPTFRVVYVEPDGTLLAADTAGQVWILDTGSDDNGAGIPIVLWSKSDDFGSPFTEKDITDLHLTLDTAGVAVSLALLANGGEGTGVVLNAASTGLGLAIVDARAIGRVRQLQLRLTGSVTTFRLAAYGVTGVPRPMGYKAWDSGPLDLGSRELQWVRRFFLKVHAGGDLTVAVYMDGALVTSVVARAGGAQDLVVPIDLGRGIVGRQPRFVITSDGDFRPYWIDVQYRQSGKGSQKSTQRVPVEGA